MLLQLDLSFHGVHTEGLGSFAVMALADLKHLRVLDLSNQVGTPTRFFASLRRWQLIA